MDFLLAGHAFPISCLNSCLPSCSPPGSIHGAQDLIAVADAGGIVRTYRPVPGEDAPEDSSKRNPSSAAAVGVGVGVGVGDAPARPFELVVECRLGARPASCEFEFAMGASTGRRRRIRRRDSGGGGGLDDRQGSGQHPGDDGEGGRDGDGGGEGGGEVLRTCTVSGSIRVWPTSSLPTRPLRPPPTSTPTSLTGVLAPLPLPLPPRGQRPSNAGDSGNNNATGGGKKGSSRPPAASVGGPGQGQENSDPSHPFSRWAASASDDQGRGTPSSAGGSGGAAAVGRGEEAAEGEGEEELVGGGLGEAPVPLPKEKPGARRRRVSFAPEDEVCAHEPRPLICRCDYSTGASDSPAAGHAGRAWIAGGEFCGVVALAVCCRWCKVSSRVVSLM